MKVHNVSIVLDKNIFHTGEKVSGKLIVETQDSHWGKAGKAFLKLYDKLDINWVEDEMVSVGVTNRAYNNFKKPFQLNVELFLDHRNVVAIDDDSSEDYKYEYPFEFQLPDRLQGRLVLRNAKCQYFIKAYLTNDEVVSKHYQEGVNVFDEFFKSLNHTYAKQEVVILNKTSFLPSIASGKHIVEAKSPHYQVTVTLPKIQFSREENIHVHIKIEHAPKSDDNSHLKPNLSTLEVHKVGFKFFQVNKLTALYPRERVRLFENLISHSSRKHLKGVSGQPIVLEEFVAIPSECASSSSRSLVKRESSQELENHSKQNPIRVNYKISLEFWKNFLVDELDINVPILIDPEV